MTRFLPVFLAGVALLGISQRTQAAPVPAKSQAVDLVLCLDVSNSMDGLIASAKMKLWDVVNELARIKPTPNLRVGLYSYGSAHYPAEAGWVRKELDLTSDLDEVYAKLNGLTLRGGDEYVARVTRDAIKEQKWSEEKNALKLIFVCGNEPANQDKQVKLNDVATLAKSQGVIINTIYCGPDSHPEAKGWKDYAADAGGKYAFIDQDKASKPVIATPFDKEIGELSGKLNGTYVWSGKEAEQRKQNQQLQDANAAKAAPAAAAERGLAKAGALYRNRDDLIDRMKTEKDFDVKKLKEEELPEELKKLKPEEREEYLKKKNAERDEIQKKIQELAAKRAKHIEEESKKQPKSDKDKALDDALRGMIREQAKAKGFEVEEKK